MAMQITNTSQGGYAPAGLSVGASVPSGAGRVAVDEPKVNSKEQAAVQQQAAQSPRATPAQLQNALASANKTLNLSNSKVEFSMDKDTGETIVKLVESRTGDVIRQYPSEEALAVAKAISDVQQQLEHRQISDVSATSQIKGLLVKQQA